MGTSTVDGQNAQLGARFRAGDPDAVHEMYRCYAGRLFALSRSMLADEQDARDAVQQTFVQAWHAADRFDPQRPLAGWLYQICRRVCIDIYRAGRREHAAATIDGSIPELQANVLSWEETWTIWQVRGAIDELPDDVREIIRLHHLEGWPLPDIADRLGLPLGTVKSRSFRAHRQLAQALRHVRRPVGTAA